MRRFGRTVPVAQRPARTVRAASRRRALESVCAPSEQAGAGARSLGGGEVHGHRLRGRRRRAAASSPTTVRARPPARRAEQAARRGDRLPHGGRRRPRRPVDAMQPRLEARAQRVVAEAEDVHLRDVRIAARAPHELAVDRGLRALVRDGDVLAARRTPRGPWCRPASRPRRGRAGARRRSSAARCRRTRPRAPA